MTRGSDRIGRPFLLSFRFAHASLWVLCCVALLLAALMEGMVRAETYQTVSLPMGVPRPPGSKLKLSGLMLTIKHNGVDGNGYAPLIVTVMTSVPRPGGPPGVMINPPSPAERRLRVRIAHSANWGQSPSVMASECEIVLPAGATQVSKTVLLPLTGSVYAYEVQTTEDGQTIQELSSPQAVVLFMNITEAENEPRYLFIDSNCPSFEDRQQITLIGGGTSTIKSEYEKRQLLPMVPMAMAVPVNRSNMVTVNGVNQAFNRSPSNDAEVLYELLKLANATMMSPDMLPETWLSHSRYDYVYVPNSELQGIKDQQPRTFASIRDWVRAGGRLVVYDINFADDLDLLERWLDLYPKARQAVSSQPRGGLSRSWEFGCDVDVRHPDLQGKDIEPLVKLAEIREVVRKQLMSSSKEERQKGFDIARRLAQPLPQPKVATATSPSAAVASAIPGTESVSPATAPAPAPPPVIVPSETTIEAALQGDEPGAGRVWLHPLGFGQVVAVAHPTIDKKFEATGTAIRRLTGKVDFVTKNGVSLDTRNKNFWNMLIPGVGEQPVYAFVTMITLFVIAIGPINYFGLLRARRLSLLLFTVPLGAGVLTLGLFLYAATADGFGVKARIRSMTLIDQRSGEAVSASRHSYYAGLAPAHGLTFDDQAAIYPIDYEPQSDGTRREIVWGENGEQNLRRGWLPSRALRQIFVTRPASTEAKLEISENGSTLVAENRLGTTIQFVVLTNSAGEMRVARNVKPGEKLNLEPIGLRDLRPILSTFVEDNRAKFPENYDPDQHESMVFSRSRRNYYYYTWRNNNVPIDPITGSSLMEQGIQDATLRSSGLARMAPRTYVAIVDKGPMGENEKPLVPIGIVNPKELGSFHLVQGTW